MSTEPVRGTDALRATLAMLLVHAAAWAPFVYQLCCVLPTQARLAHRFNMRVPHAAEWAFAAAAFAEQNRLSALLALAALFVVDATTLARLNRDPRARDRAWGWFVLMAFTAAGAALGAAWAGNYMFEKLYEGLNR